MIPATLVDILGQDRLAQGFGVSDAVAGPVTMLILPTTGNVYKIPVPCTYRLNLLILAATGNVDEIPVPYT